MTATAPGMASAEEVHFRTAGNIDISAVAGVKKNCVLFYHPSCKDLAEKVAATSEDIVLGQIDWGCELPQQNLQ